VVIGSATRNSNIRVTNCVIHDIGTPTRAPVSFGTFGINCGPVNGLEIDHNTIYNITVANNFVTVAGGAQTKYGITVSADALGPVTMTGNTVTGAKTAGIRLSSPRAQTVTGNTVTGCATGILLKDTSGAATIRGNTISGNTSGAENLSASVADATLNYWGSEKGPEHASNPAGAGDTVSDKVRYSPWVTTAGGQTQAYGQLAMTGAYDSASRKAVITITSPAGISTLASVKVQGAPVTPEFPQPANKNVFTVGLYEGTNVVNVRATDSTGNIYVGSCTVSKDTVPPVTQIVVSAPPGGLNGWYRAAPTITLSTEAGATLKYGWRSRFPHPGTCRGRT